MAGRLRNLLNWWPWSTPSSSGPEDIAMTSSRARYQQMDDDPEAANTSDRPDESDRSTYRQQFWRWWRGMRWTKKKVAICIGITVTTMAVIWLAYHVWMNVFANTKPTPAPTTTPVPTTVPVPVEDQYFAECQPPIPLPFHPNGTGRFPEEGLHFIPCKAAHDFNVALMKQVKDRMAEGLWNKDGTIVKEGGEDSFKKYSIHYALAIAKPTNVTYEELDGHWGKEYGKVKCFSISHWATQELPGPNWMCEKGQAAYTDLATAEDRSLFPDEPAKFMHYTQGRVLLFALLHNSDFKSVMHDVVSHEVDLKEEAAFEFMSFEGFLSIAADPDYEDQSVAHLNGEELRTNSNRWRYRAGFTVKPVRELLRRLEKSCMIDFTPKRGQTWADCIREYIKSEDAMLRRQMMIAGRLGNVRNAKRFSDDLFDEL